jgi:signal transduction histidine kinase
VDIVNNLKKFTRVDEAAFQETDIHEGIDSALFVLKHDLKSGVRVVKEYGDIPLLHASPSELSQVFMTLIKNANDAIDGQGTITIRTWRDRGNVYASFEDTGNGIPPEMLGKLFDIGFIAKRSRVGMRIGLSTAHAIVKSHEGDIRVKSDFGKGAEFTVLLPIR